MKAELSCWGGTVLNVVYGMVAAFMKFILVLMPCLAWCTDKEHIPEQH
jgi:hypothetical protein